MGEVVAFIRNGHVAAEPLDLLKAFQALDFQAWNRLMPLTRRKDSEFAFVLGGFGDRARLQSFMSPAKSLGRRRTRRRQEAWRLLLQLVEGPTPDVNATAKFRLLLDLKAMIDDLNGGDQMHAGIRFPLTQEERLKMVGIIEPVEKLIAEHREAYTRYRAALAAKHEKVA